MTVRMLESPGIPVSMRITVSAIHWWEQDSCHLSWHEPCHGQRACRAGKLCGYWRDEYPQVAVLGIHDIAKDTSAARRRSASLSWETCGLQSEPTLTEPTGISLPADMLCSGSLKEEQVAADIQREQRN